MRRFKSCKLLLLLAVLSIIQACGLTATRPKLEMSLAAAAFIAATKAKANMQAPNIYRKAEMYFIKAKSSYRRKYFNKAKQYALMSQQFSEKAEFIAVRKATLENTE